jgi:hypothetical protein
VPAVVDDTKAWSKYWKPSMTPITSVKKITGVIIGSVTCRNRCQALAPSIAMAS